ncbi:hydrolase [Halomonas huangheensis]|nr:hydrolase [Halomonas huangheensis]ALM52614.1 alpha/beta hydrolase [Halomonas huangheensis]
MTARLSDMTGFRAPSLIRNPHVQTLLPRILRPPPLVWRGEWFDLPDGDEVELGWVSPEPQDDEAPILVMFHGLEGSIASPYASAILGTAAHVGHRALIMHFRGCGSRPNRRPRAYHSGDTGDARVVLEELRRRYPLAPLRVCGVSLGGNMLLRLLAEPGSEVLGIASALVISAPLDLAACSERLSQGFSRVYERHLLKSLKRKVIPRLVSGELPLEASAEQVARVKRLRDYDDIITAPLHGFANAEDYYTRASSGPVLDRIAVPTWLVHAEDDPFMPADLLQRFPRRSAKLKVEVSRHGGHVGFMRGSGWRYTPWLEERTIQFLGG